MNEHDAHHLVMLQLLLINRRLNLFQWMTWQKTQHIIIIKCRETCRFVTKKKRLQVMFKKHMATQTCTWKHAAMQGIRREVQGGMTHKFGNAEVFSSTETMLEICPTLHKQYYLLTWKEDGRRVWKSLLLILGSLHPLVNAHTDTLVNIYQRRTCWCALGNTDSSNILRDDR